MDASTAQKLNSINREFYARNAASFSKTREGAWPGWGRLLEQVGSFASVLDIACGNMRFKSFVEAARPGLALDYYGVDVSDDLAGVHAHVVGNYQHLDIVDAAVGDRDLAPLLNAPACDLVVSFGFMHHVPGMEARLKALDLIAEKTREGGFACVSFWNFMQDPKLASKARRVTEAVLARTPLDLDEGDWLLDWNGEAEVPRYCHSFDDADIDAIVSHAAHRHAFFQAVDRYRSDGRNGELNTYVVFHKAPASPANPSNVQEAKGRAAV